MPLTVDMDDEDFEFDVHLYARYKGEPLTGELVEHDPSGALRGRTGYRDGKPHGLSRGWYPDGTLRSEASMEHDRAVGVAKEFHPNGALAEERYFEQGSGSWVETRRWAENGDFVVEPPHTGRFAIPDSAEAAAGLQRLLVQRVRRRRALPDPFHRHFAGVDLRRRPGDGAIVASVAVLGAATFQEAERSTYLRPADGPGGPDGLSGPGELRESVEPSKPGGPVGPGAPGPVAEIARFQEVAAVVEALRGLTIPPGVIVCTGPGASHAADFDFATHLGAWIAKPTFGVADRPAPGSAYTEPGPRRGDRSDLVYQGEVIGSVLRTQAEEPPVVVTPGQHLELDEAVELALLLAPAHSARLPAPAVAAAIVAASAAAG